MRADLEAERGRVGAHQLINAVRRNRLVKLSGSVIANRPEQRAAVVLTVSGGFKVFMNERVGAWMQRHIAGLAAFAGHLEMRHALARVPEVPNLELAEFLAAQRMEKQRRENGAVALAANAAIEWRIEQLARLMIAKGWRLAFAAFRLGRSTPLTGLCVTAFFSHRYSNSAAIDASRFRIVLPPSSRRTRSSRQAMTCARVTIRNSSGRAMPVKRMKSFTAFS
jgi:hypothetical protein